MERKLVQLLFGRRRMKLSLVFAAAVSFVLASTEALSIRDIPLKAPENDGKLWALLVAGSKYFSNYRHQADVCHAYQVVHAHGIPDENIVVMMYDDIANNYENKFKGKIINKPNGPDVYHGVPHDYTGDSNNPKNFLTILEGVQSPENNVTKVINSGPNDHVFVFFADHGAPGIVAFGEDVLKATDLMQVIKRKHANKGFAKMVLYIEACESGSMFENLLPDNLDVFATTAANSSTSSYACYFDSELQTYLGDVYSVKWLEDSDREDLHKETLEKQFEIVKDETNTSEVCEFGDLSISRLPLSEFLGAKSVTVEDRVRTANDGPDAGCGKDAVPSGEVPRMILEKKVEAAKTPEGLKEAKEKLAEYMKYRKTIENKMHSIVTSVTLDADQADQIMLSKTPVISDHSCYYKAIDAFHAHCYNLGRHEYALRMVFALANLCERGHGSDVIVEAIEDHCWMKPNIEVY